MAERFIDLPTEQFSFSPSVLIDGETYTPPGWMWLLAFALRGQPWAIKQLEECEPTVIRPVDIYRLALAAATIVRE